MKKILTILLLLCLLCAVLSSCSNQKNPETEMNPGQGGAQPQDDPASSPGIDVDLTALSSTMVFAEVSNMMENPADYVGKTIKASGVYYSSYYDKTGKYYHYVLVEDATACCSKGLEFVWSGDHVYPTDYPQHYTRVEVTGVFGVYEEFGETYSFLTVDAIVVG